MARYKKVNYDQLELIPVNFSEQVLKGTFEYTINYVIEEQADLSCFDSNYKNDKTGSKAILPSVLLKVILFAYSKGIISSRNIEDSCFHNVVFKALSANTVPDHSTIAAFVSGMKDQINTIFQYVLMVCSSSGLIGNDMFAVDGCKLPSNASKDAAHAHPCARGTCTSLYNVERNIIRTKKEERQIRETCGNPHQ